MTETSPLGSVSRAAGAASTGEEAWRYRITQGRLPASVEARLVGPDGSEVAAGTAQSVGELEVRGPWITGSLRPATTDPDKFDDGWLRTGDVGTHHPRRLPHPDRPGQGRHQVRRRVDLLGRPGERADGAPGGRRGLRWSACRTRSGASARWRPWWCARGRASAPSELRDFLAERVAHWQLPERWAFVDEVPKTRVGKFDKKVIRRRYADGALDVQTLSSK